MPHSRTPSFSELLKAITANLKELLTNFLFLAQKLLSRFLPDSFKRDFLSIPLGIWIGLGLTALMSQLKYWGDPLPFLDQQYYLFGGGQILQGKVPYIDFWDCKPVGLFLLFSFIRLFDPFQYYVLPILSSLFLFAGSLGLYKTARLFARKPHAFCIGFAYVLLNTFYNMIIDGQSEQFFVPLIIWAIYLLFRQTEKIQQSLINLFFTGNAIMLIFGIAVEIKPSCVFEGILTGLSLLFLFFFHCKLSPLKKLFCGMLFGLIWVLMALLPTILIIGWYFEHHHFSDWFFANIQSNGKRVRWMATQAYTENYHKHILRYSIVLLCVCLSVLFLFRHQSQENISLKKRFLYVFILLWTIITLIAGILLRGGFVSFHYMLPAVPPLLLLSAILWEKEWFLNILISIGFLLGSGILIRDIQPLAFGERGESYYRFQKFMNQQPGCLFTFTGFSGGLFLDATKATASCNVTKYLFPDFLFDPQYRFALPTNPEKELEQILAKQPLYLILPERPETKNCAIKNTCEDKDSFWVENIFPSREWQLLANTLKNYTPLYVEEHHWAFYKLNSGLVPKITPPDIAPSPSLPVTFPPPKKEDKKFKKRLNALKLEVSKWPEPQ